MSEVFASGLGMPETPVRLSDGSWLLVEMSSDRGCVTQLSPDGTIARIICRTGRPNGVRSGAGALWVAESGSEPALLRVSMEGESSTWVTSADGRPFLFPNDLCFGRKGELYMTDSGIPRHVWDSVPSAELDDLDFDGRVYRIDVHARTAEILDDGLRFANGLALDPTGRSLLVNETITGAIYRYDLSAGDVGESRQLFANVLAPDVEADLQGPDGMAFGADGRLYVAMFGQGDVTVVEPSGAIACRLPTEGRLPTNVAFGARGEKRLYVTEIEFGCLERLEVDTAAAPDGG
jgi:gluconolactonase